MNQSQRDQRAILTVLQHGQPVTMEQIRLQAGEVPFSAMLRLLNEGKVAPVWDGNSETPVTYRLTK